MRDECAKLSVLRDRSKPGSLTLFSFAQGFAGSIIVQTGITSLPR